MGFPRCFHQAGEISFRMRDRLHNGYIGFGGPSILDTAGRGAGRPFPVLSNPVSVRVGRRRGRGVKARSGPVQASMTMAGVLTAVARLQTHLTELERGLVETRGFEPLTPCVQTRIGTDSWQITKHRQGA